MFTGMSYEIADGWELVEGQTNVFCRKVAAVTADTSFAVIKGNEITENIPTANPTLKITAYAVQQENIADAAAAWEAANPTTTTP